MPLAAPSKKSRYKQGKYLPMNPSKYVGKCSDITYRSGWELKFMRWCDMNPSVVRWNSEGLVIPYWSRADGKERRYYMDFMIQYRAAGGALKAAIVEIKPESQTKPPRKSKNEKTYMDACHTWMVNQDKWEHARAWAQKNGCEFIIMTEHQLGIAPKPAAKPKKAKVKPNGNQ